MQIYIHRFPAFVHRANRKIIKYKLEITHKKYQKKMKKIQHLQCIT